jgi:hypothetical protein
MWTRILPGVSATMVPHDPGTCEWKTFIHLPLLPQNRRRKASGMLSAEGNYSGCCKCAWSREPSSKWQWAPAARGSLGCFLSFYSAVNLRFLVQQRWNFDLRGFLSRSHTSEFCHRCRCVLTFSTHRLNSAAEASIMAQGPLE